VKVTTAPAQSSPELAKTVERLASLLPQVAALFGVSVPAGGHSPKPLRPARPTAKKIPPKPAAVAPAPTEAAVPVVAADPTPAVEPEAASNEPEAPSAD